MLFRRRALFLAGLFVAVSCSDAGNPLDPGGPVEPGPGDAAANLLQAFICKVDAAGHETCRPDEPNTGDALGAIAIGDSLYVKKLTTTVLNTADSLHQEVRLLNRMQPLGTTDGVNPHPYGIRVWVEPPFDIDTIVAGQPTSVTVANPFGTMTWNSNLKNRPYFRYAQILPTGDTSAVQTWRFAKQNVSAFQYKVYVATEVQFPQGWLDITPASPVVQVSGVDTLTAHVRGAFGQRVTENLNWSSSNTSVVTVAELTPVDSLAQITGVGEGTAWVRAVSAVNGVARRDSVLVTVDNAPVVQLDSIDAPARVSVRISSARLREGLAEGDSVVPNQVRNTARGIATVDAERGLTYISKGSFAGTDTVPINVTDGEWTVADTLLVKVAASNYWFVRQGGTGEGGNTRPLGSISAAADSAGAGDTIFVLRNGATELVGTAELNSGQALIGHGVAATLFLREENLNEPGRVDTIFQGQSLGTPLASTGAPTVTLSGNNRVLGVNLTSADAAAIHGVGFGTLTVGDVIVQAGGPALSLSSGQLAGSFLALHSQNSDSSGISLHSVTGSATAAASSISGPAGTAFLLTGGSVSLSLPGDITQSSSNPLLSVSGHSGGTLTFGGTLSATSGTGVQFSNADGTYAFDGAVSLNGGDAALDLLSASDGVFTFANATIANPSGGPALNVVGGTPALVYRGSLTHHTGRAVVVDGITADSVVLRAAIASGTSGSPTGLGILVQSMTNGRVVLDSVKSLFTGSNPAVTLNNAGGTVRFGGSLDITTTTGAGFAASGSDTVTVTGVNTVSTTTGIPVSLTGVHTGAGGVSFSSVSTSAGAANGIVLSSLLGGAGFQATGGTVSGTTGPAVLLTATSAVDSVSLRNLTLSRAAGTGGVISGSTFGKLHTLNTTVSATGGPGALALTTGTLSGSFASLSSASSTASGVSLTGVNGTLNVSAGTINTASAAAFLLSGGGVGGTVSATVSQTAVQPLLSVTGGHTGALTFAGNVSANNGTGLQFTDADGSYTFTGSLALAGGDAGIDIASASVGTVDVNPAGANTAAITSPSGVAISIAGGSADLTYRGNVTQGVNSALLLVNGGHGGDVAFPSGTLSATNGTGLQFDNADGTYDFDGTVTLNGGDAGIDITNGSGGTFTFPGTSSITNPNTGNAVSILNSAPAFTYPGAFNKTNNNVTGILLSGNTGGTVTFNGDGTTLDGDPADVTKTLSTGTGNAVSLVNNTGMTMVFAGGMSLTTAAATAFNATGGGTVTITGAGNTVSTTGGTGVNIQNTTIGAAGVSLLSVTASGGSAGIVLQNTGAGGLQVTGSGTHGSGGTVANTVGGDGALAGNGVYLENATGVNLSWMNFSGHQNHAVRGIGVSNVTLTRLRITGTNGTNAGFDEGAIVFTNLTGSAAISSSYIEGGFEDNVRVANATGTLNRLTMSNDTIGHNGSSGNDGVLLDASSGAVLNVTVQNSRFTGSRSNNVHYVLNNNAAGDFVFNNNVLTNNHPNKLGSDFGINVGSTSNGTMTYTISGNTVRDAGGSGIEVSHLAGGTGPMTGSITNNFVGVAGVANSGSTAGSTIVAAVVGAGANATHNTTITGNTLRQFTNYGIRLINRGTGDGYLNAVVQNNNIAEPSPNAASFGAHSGIRAELGASSVGPDNGRTCLTISGNTLNQTTTGSAQAELRIFGRFGTRTAIPGLGASDPNTFLAAQNTITPPGGGTAVNATSTNPFQSSCPPT